MATIPQIKGALLEEGILYLLDGSDYDTVTNIIKYATTPEIVTSK